MKTGSPVFLAILLALLTAGCSILGLGPAGEGGAVPPASSPCPEIPLASPCPPCPPPPVEPIESIGLGTYSGRGFYFQYPLSAHVEEYEVVAPVLSEVRVVGPDIEIRPGDADWLYSGAAYELRLRLYANPDGLGVENWARNHILYLWETAVDQGAPVVMPVDDAGQIHEDFVGSTVLAGEPAFWVSWFGGDSAMMEYFVVHGDMVISITYSEYPLANQPITLVQKDVYALISGTLRLQESSGETASPE